MANLDDLGFSSITDVSREEGLETLRLIRQNRLTPTTRTKKPASRKTSNKSKDINLSQEQAERLLRKLTGE